MAPGYGAWPQGNDGREGALCRPSRKLVGPQARVLVLRIAAHTRGWTPGLPSPAHCGRQAPCVSVAPHHRWRAPTPRPRPFPHVLRRSAPRSGPPHLGCGPAAGGPPWHPEGGRPRGWRSSWCLGAPPLGRLAARLAVLRGCAVGVLPAARVLRCRRVPGFAWRLPSTSVPLLT